VESDSSDKRQPVDEASTSQDDDHSFVRLQRRRGDAPAPPEPELHETVQGSKPGSRFVRLTRSRDQRLRRVSEREFEATKAVLTPQTRVGRIWDDFRHFFIGRTLATSELTHERLSKVKALAIFSSDNLSSSAYATEEILLVLLLAGTAALTDAIPIALAIAVLAAIVATSYRQTIYAYPNGGGAYVVAKENLGQFPSMVAGSALFVDYILTVAVSTAAGVAAVTSAIPDLHAIRIEMAVAFVALLTVGNLRGIRESGTIFAVPTYFFILIFGGMLVFGLARLLLGEDLKAATPADALPPGTHSLTIFLVLRAFASGCAALTGIEAIANGVPYFKPPESKNASTTLVWMATILAAFFLGSTVLAHQFGIVPAESKTVVAQIAQTVFGGGSPFFYMVQVATALILILAANTSFAGLPAAASVMARDGVMPDQFAFRGDRLAFSNGIIVVGVLSSVLLIAFQAETHKLIPLYAFGVFTAFTMSQLGMIVHWKRKRDAGWRRSLLINAVGALATGIVAIIIGATKFLDGAWLSMGFMAGLVFVLWRIKAHYDSAKAQLERGLNEASGVAEHFYAASVGRPQTVIVPVEGINRAVLRTIAYARTLSPNAIAVHVTDDREKAEALRAQWEDSIPDTPLDILYSPYRSLVEPILTFIERFDRAQPNHMVTVVLPVFVPKHFWERFLHNQLSLRLKKELVDRPNTVVVDVPYHFH
jgi:amino acid transporter